MVPIPEVLTPSGLQKPLRPPTNSSEEPLYIAISSNLFARDFVERVVGVGMDE